MDRLKDFVIGVTNTSVEEVPPAPDNYQQCAHHVQPFRDYLLLACDGGPITGR